MAIISFLNHKGGVSKTATSIHTAYELSKRGHKVLVIDLDHQMNLTEFFIDRDYKYNIENVFNDYLLLDQAIIETRYTDISILPASDNIPLIEYEIIKNNHPLESLNRMLSGSDLVRSFDFVIIDTHPGIYPFVTCALIASDYYIVPLLSECSFSLDGLLKVEGFVDDIRKQVNCNPSALGYLITQFISRNKLSRAYLDSIKQNRGDQLFKSIIRRNTHIPIALSEKKVVGQYEPGSNGKYDYCAFVDELLERIACDG